MLRYLHSLLKAIDLEVPSGLANPEIKNLSCDSREIETGDLFLGLEGEKVDGGTYWKKAIESGASAEETSLLAADGLEPPSDLNASTEYRSHLARVLTKRGLQESGK